MTTEDERTAPSDDRPWLLAGPAARPDPSYRLVVLLDNQLYPHAAFEGLRGAIHLGPGVEGLPGQGYRLSAAAAPLLAELDRTPVRGCFALPSDTHVKQMAGLMRAVQGAKKVIRTRNDLSARKALLREGWRDFEPAWRASLSGVDVVLAGIDWSLEEQLLIARARSRGVPTACLQESIVAFGDARGRMEWADVAFVQGPATLAHLRRDVSFLVGNPRYEGIQRLPLPDRPRVLVNCNFTFGVFEEAGRPWLRSAVSAIEALALPYAISVHPRCHLDLSDFQHLCPSGPYAVHEQLAAATVLVTRFSSLAHEALLMGRPVVYFNPHGESFPELSNDVSGAIVSARTRAELQAAIEEAIRRPVALSASASMALFSGGAGSIQRCQRGLAALKRYPVLARTSDRRPLDRHRLSARLLRFHAGDYAHELRAWRRGRRARR